MPRRPANSPATISYCAETATGRSRHQFAKALFGGVTRRIRRSQSSLRLPLLALVALGLAGAADHKPQVNEEIDIDGSTSLFYFSKR
jgi:hypothetical protein